MIKKVIGDLLKPMGFGPDCLLHIVNLHHIWGGGIVIPIKKLYPEAYQADLKTPKSDKKKLGTYSLADVRGSGGSVLRPSYIFNIYGMPTMGLPVSNIDYGALRKAFISIRNSLEEKQKQDMFYLTVGMSAQIGQGLANGCPKTISNIIEDVWADYPTSVYLYELPD